MRESDRKIKEYRKMLPGLRARISSAAMFFLVSIIMMVASTFAWVTLSIKPEVKGIQTTITGNGNLEIALASEDGEAPLESAIGDAEKEITKRNKTWGNLVNLSDESYGLSNIVLRPASLNSSSLLSSPLYAASYGEDGRVNELTSEFAFTNYDKSTKTFMVPGTTQYGVRAISSVTYTFAGGSQIYAERLQDAKSKLTLAKSEYNALTGSDTNMTTISTIMGTYLTDEINGDGNASDYQKHVPQIYAMLQQFEKCLDATGETILRIANLQLMLKKGNTVDPYTMDTLMSASAAELSENGVSIEGFDTYKSDKKLFAIYMNKIEEINQTVTENGTEVKWYQLKDTVNFLIDINSTLVDGTSVSDLTADKSGAISTILGTSNHVAVVTKGALYNIEKILGTYMYAEKLPITVKYGISVTLKADIYTAASPDCYIPTAINKIENGDTNFKGTDPVAADTYGMAVDVWVRTNAQDDYLVLEGGLVKTDTQKTDSAGNKYYTDKDSGKVILLTPSEKYIDETGEEVEVNADNLEVTYEMAYKGANRVWNDGNISDYATTQGNGSCYIFYAETPQEQAQSLELLKAMTVVFVDDTGKLLAYADMDTESCYAESGRVTVPLKLRSTSLNAGNDENGDPIYAITSLVCGEAKRITALIYVDGAKLSNTDVLSKNKMEGQLNIQFGTASDLNAVKNDDVYYDEIHITGKATPNKFDFTQGDESEGQDGKIKSRVELYVDGEKPETVKASFIRQINSTQGTKQKEITFVKDESGAYVADVIFDAPGEYVLRTAWLNGVEYRLEEAIKVSITGFAISSVGWNHVSNNEKVMTADSSHSETYTIEFAGNSIQPSSVQALLTNEKNQQITVNFRKGTSNWSGTAQFTTSGTYSLDYVLIDGEYYDIPTTMKKHLELSLGMKAKVQLSQTVFPDYDGSEKSIDVYVTILDNVGNELEKMDNASLQYLSQSSSLTENGLYTSLTWNENKARYEGKFSLKKAGAYQFAYITIAGSTINSATAPIVTAIPPVPPTYYANLTEANIFAFGSDVNMRIALADSSAVANGNIIATLQKLDAEGNVEVEVKVKGTSAAHIGDTGNASDVVDWLFKIPTTEELRGDDEDSTLSQLGTWKMTSLSIIGAYNDGVISTEEDPYIMNVEDKGIETTINDEMTVHVSGNGQSIASNKFLEAGKADEGLAVQIRGAGGEVATGVTDVQVTYKLTSVKSSSGTTDSGYNSDSATALKNQISVTANLVEEAIDGVSQYILDSDNPMMLAYAGTYEVDKVSFKIGNSAFSTSVANSEKANVTEVSINKDEAPSYTYEWQAPVVKITGVSPETSNANTASDDENDSIYQKVTLVTKNNEITNTTATVYFNTITKKAGYKDRITTVDHYVCPTVETEISNLLDYNAASLVINASGVMDGVDVSGNASAVTFTYTSAETSSKQTIGSVGTYIKSNRYVLGMGAQGTHIKVTGTKDNLNITYIFQLANPITINNPY